MPTEILMFLELHSAIACMKWMLFLDHAGLREHLSRRVVDVPESVGAQLYAAKPGERKEYLDKYHKYYNNVTMRYECDWRTKIARRSEN